jgi:hypothetical protein
MAPKHIWALALGLLAATFVSTVAPTHLVWNPPVLKFLLGAFALTAAFWAREAGRWASAVARDAEAEFVVSFDDHIISLTQPDGSTDVARFDELEKISIEPQDNPYFDLWMGPFYVALYVPGRRLLIPAFTVGLYVLLGRLLELPGIDSEGIQGLWEEGEQSPRVVWTRQKAF